MRVILWSGGISEGSTVQSLRHLPVSGFAYILSILDIVLCGDMYVKLRSSGNIWRQISWRPRDCLQA